MTTTSTSVSSFSLSVKASFWTSAMASRWLRFIFQLPAIRGRRVGALANSGLQYGETGQGAALEVLQARPSPGRDVGEGRLVEAQRTDRGGGVTAPDDGQRSG